MKPTKKVGMLLLAAYLIIHGVWYLTQQVQVSGMPLLLALLGIAAGIFLIMDR